MAGEASTGREPVNALKPTFLESEDAHRDVKFGEASEREPNPPVVDNPSPEALTPELVGAQGPVQTRTIVPGRRLDWLAFTLVMVLAAADRKSTRLNSSHVSESRMPSSA